jgi:hypothetical protein
VVVRPSDWFLVDLGSDPTPGDAFGIRGLAAKYAAIATIAGEASDGVTRARSSGAASAWIGDAGDIFRDRSHRMPGELAKARDSYSMVAEALRSWAESVDDTQAQADRGLQQAREAHADLSSAHAALGSAQSSWSTVHAQQLTYQKLQKDYASVPPPASVGMPTPDQLRSSARGAQQAQASIAASQSRIADADARLAAAKALVHAAKERRDDAERTIAHRISAAEDHAVKPSSIWESIQDSAAWQAVVAVATVVLMIVTIIAIVVGGPLVWALIIAATVLLMVNALMSIAQGKDAWGELALLAVGLIPGGRLVELGATAFRTAAAGLGGVRAAIHFAPAIERVGAAITRAGSAIRGGAAAVRDGVAAASGSLRTVITSLRSGEHALGPEWDRVATLINRDVKDYLVNADAPSFGRMTEGGLGWAMPAEDAARIVSPMDAARQSGNADSILTAARNGDEIYALFSNSDRMQLREPTIDDALGNINFLPGGGHTAIAGDTFFLVNPTREMVTPGTLLGPDAVITQLVRVAQSNTWVWDIVHRFG